MLAPSFGLPAYREGVEVRGSRASVPEEYGGGNQTKEQRFLRWVNEHDRPCAHVDLGSGPA
jgi:hypothetical protein